MKVGRFQGDMHCEKKIWVGRWFSVIYFSGQLMWLQPQEHSGELLAGYTDHPKKTSLLALAGCHV